MSFLLLAKRAKNSIVIKHATYVWQRRDAIVEATGKLLCDRKVLSVYNYTLLTAHELKDRIQDELEGRK